MELGSEFNLSLSKLNIVEGNFFSYLSDFNCIYTNTGRSALRIIAQLVKNILLPEFICESVLRCFNRENIRFYKVTENGQIDLDDLLSKIDLKTDGIFLMHYFGTLQSETILNEIRKIADKNKIVVIEDMTHSLFSAKRTIGDYMIASVRKWMPIPLGGVVYSKKELPSIRGIEKSYDNERLYGMILKDLYLNKALDCNETYRKIFEKCEKDLDKKDNIEFLSDISRFIISCMDVKTMINRRKTNYNYLMKKFREIGLNPICKLNKDECPFVYPIRVPDRNEFRKYLIENQIYCAVHWPFDNYLINERKMALKNSKTLISLPIDQRYGEEDMDYMINVVKTYGGELLF